MPRSLLMALALMTAVYAVLPSVAAELPGDGYYCSGAYQRGCMVCTEWHTHYAPPPQTGSEEHRHHAYFCFEWVLGRCNTAGDME